jgi:hypothetical protein
VCLDAAKTLEVSASAPSGWRFEGSPGSQIRIFALRKTPEIATIASSGECRLRGISISRTDLEAPP